MIHKVIEHEFFRKLANYARPLVELHRKEFSIFRDGYVPKRKLSAEEEYVRRTLLSAGELATICNQLHQAVIFLTNFRSTPKLKEQKIDGFDHVVYHLEGHLIRSTACFDRCLILVNDVFLLGNPYKNCKAHIILKNKYVLETPVADFLKEMNNHIEPYRSKRNIVIHQKSYTHGELRTIEGISILEKQGENIFHHYYVKLINDFVNKRKQELIEFNEKLYKIIEKFLSELLVVFENKYKILKLE